MTRLPLATGLLLTTLIGACAPAGDGGGDAITADLILAGGHVHTPDGGGATAVAVAGNRILAVGDDATVGALAGPDTRRIDLQGAWLGPGFNDGHAHLYGLGKALSQVRLAGTGSVAEILDLVAEAHAGLPDGAWLEGRGWDQNDWDDPTWPTAVQLDAVTGGRPALLRRVDGHAAWANSAALAAAGIKATTADPEGGEIVRGVAGEPTGVLIDNAVDLVYDVIPEPPADEVERRVRLAVAHCVERGVTGVHDAGASWERVQLYRRLADAGELGLRVYAMYDDDEETLVPAFAHGPLFSADSLLTARAVKLYGDGALGSRGALLLADYSDKPGHRGLAVTSPGHMRDVMERAAAAGIQVGTHAIGDGANRLVLDLYEEVLGADGLAPVRWRVEHAQIVHPDDLPRFAALGVIPAMQPTHCTSDMDWADERLGEDRLTGAYAWRTLCESGAHVCFGTDFPVERVEPLEGLYAARTRMHPDGTPIGGWRPEETLTAAQAFDLYTAGSAYAAFREDDLGRVAPGCLADLVVLDGDPIACEPQALLAMGVRLTVVNGQVVYERP